MIIHIIMDLVCVALIVLFMLHGWKKGLILSLAGFITTVASIGGAILISELLAPPMGKALNSKVEPLIQEKLDSIAAEDIGSEVSEIVRNALTDLGISEKVAEEYANAIADVGGNTIDGLVSVSTEKIAHLIAYVLIFIVSFIVLLIVIKLLARLLDGICKLPVLHFVNSFGGLVLALLSAAALFCAADFIIAVGVVGHIADGAGNGVGSGFTAALFNDHHLGLGLIGVVEEHNGMVAALVEHIAGAQVFPVADGFINVGGCNIAGVVKAVAGIHAPDCHGNEG